MIVNIKVQNQTLAMTGETRIIADSVNYLKFEFEFSAEWGNPKHAVFYGGEGEKAVVITLGENGKYFCLVPSEMIKFPYFEMSLYCAADNKRITTNKLEIPVEKSGYKETEVSPDENPALHNPVYTPSEEDKRVTFMRHNDGNIEWSEDGGNWTPITKEYDGKEKKDGARCANPNILHNWDFRNPVNQRGLAEYTTAGYNIDRWTKSSAASIVRVMDNFVRIEVATVLGSPTFTQFVEFPEKYAGKTATLSFIYRTASSSVPVFYIPGASGVIPLSAEWTLLSRTFTFPAALSELRFYIQFLATNNYAVGDAIDIQAVKLEVGEVSTLANDAPMDYGRELAVCQRYQYLSSAGAIQHIRTGAIDGDSIFFELPCPVSMRINPVLARNSDFYITDFNNEIQSDFKFEYTVSNGSVIIDAMKERHGLTDAILNINGALFDANL
jgi:hypothetical protein